MAPIVRFCFDDTDGLTLHKQHVIGLADVGQVFAHGDTWPRVEINFVFILNMPASRGQFLIDRSRAICSGVWFCVAGGIVLFNLVP